MSTHAAGEETVEAEGVGDAMAVGEGFGGESLMEAETVDFQAYFRKTFQISSEIRELVDDKGHFQMTPAAPKDKYPSAEEAFVKLSELHSGFSKRTGFGKVTPEEDRMYYFLAKDYINSLLSWLDGKTTETPDLTVNNSHLLTQGSKSKLKKHYLSRNSQIITEELWNQLVLWFGGGPEIKLPAKFYQRQVTIDTTGKMVRVVCQKDLSRYRRFLFSGHQTIMEAKEAMCDVFEVDPLKCRLHDYYKNRPFAQLDKETASESASKKKLSEKNLMDDNLIFLELPDEEGDYVIKYTQRGYQIRQLNDTIEGTDTGTRGVVGLRNLMNTCYMNSTLQCLSNTPMLKEAFLSKSFEADINKDNVLGYKGKVAKAFFKVMDKMWSHQGSVVAPYGFKKAISDAKTDFRGVEQHDSQEFLSQLLDAMHEDLNRVKEKPYVESPEQNGRPDEVVAKESMEVYKMRNDSVIVDLFTGLYKSTVTCPDESCKNVSVTFDPFMILSLPLQSGEKHYHVIHITHVPLNPRTPPETHQVIVPKHGPFFLLEEIIKEKTGINRANEEFMANPVGATDEAEKLGMVFDEAENMNGAKRDVLIFEQRLGRLSDFFTGARTLSRLSQSSSLISYEVFESKKFEFSQELPDTDYKRTLDAPRKVVQATVRETRYYDRTNLDMDDRGRTGSDDDQGYGGDYGERYGSSRHHRRDGEDIDVENDYAEVRDGEDDDEERRQRRERKEKERQEREEKREKKEKEREKREKEREEEREKERLREEMFEPERVGEVGCPFLTGDTWHGKYQLNDNEQLMRLEIVEVTKMSYEHYDDYRRMTLRKCHNMPQKDTELTEEEFGSRDVYLIVAFGDTKEKQFHTGGYSYRRQQVYHSAFEMRGVFISHPKDSAVKGVSVERQKVRKSVKVDAEEKEQDNDKKSQGSDNKEKNKEVEEKQKDKEKQKEKEKKKGKFSRFNFLGGKSKREKPSGKVAEEGAPKSPEAALEAKQKAKEKNEKKEKVEKKKTVKNMSTVLDMKDLSLQKQADILKTGELEKAFEAGVVVLRPTNKREKLVVSQGYYNNYSSSREPEGEDREPIILTGVIDKAFCYFYGKFRVDQGFNKGEFLLQKYESYNWDHSGTSLLAAQNGPVGDIVNKTKYPEPPPLDERILVAICHSVHDRSSAFGSIPDIMFVPGEITETEFMQSLVSRVKVYLQETLKKVGEEQVVVDEETGAEMDRIDGFLKDVKVVRANSRFLTTSYQSHYVTSRPRASVGVELDRHSDRLLRTDENEVELYLVVKWPDKVPFEMFRSSKLFDAPPDEESKMTLNGAVSLFSKTEKLSANNTWYCRKCKEHQQAYKQLQLWSLPDVLVVQFKRFSQNEGRNVADKLEIAVDFPFEMNLAEQTLGQENVEDCDYELMAVSSHVGGGLGFGHYIACAKNELDDCWYEFDDSLVTKIRPTEKDKIVNPQAYVLFYAKKSALRVRRQELVAKAEAEAAEAAAKAETEGAEAGAVETEAGTAAGAAEPAATTEATAEAAAEN